MNLMEASPFNPYIEETGNSIKSAINKAVKEETKLPDWILSLHGMSGKRYRIFINNLIENIQDARYLEIGSWSGSTVCSAVYKNKVHSACIDNWTQFGDVRHQFTRNINNTLRDEDQNTVDLYEQDYREVDYNSTRKFNLYLIEDQYDGLKYALPTLDDTFIFLVDDWNDPRPREGTEKAIEELGVEVIYSMQIRTSNGVDRVYPEIVLQDSHWHNGYFISVCKKK